MIAGMEFQDVVPGRSASRGVEVRALLLAVACCWTSVVCTASPAAPGRSSPDPAIVPVPVSVQAVGTGFTLASSTPILTPPGLAEPARVAGYLAGVLRRSTGYRLPVSASGAAGACPHGICLGLRSEGRLGSEGYELDVSGEGVRLWAARAEGLFRGVQTLRQLLPPGIERATAQPGPWSIPGVRIVDYPRFAWRGAALDVARHFLTVDEVKRYVDLISLYKIDVLHLHLTDDQGWRIAIDRWPRLATHGGSTAVGGGAGGYYTQRDYADIVRYAEDRYVTVVPEIDVPGHTNAALASYAELNCDGHAAALYTGVAVGISSLCLDGETTYRFLDQVIGDLAALTPGAYLHIGGDEPGDVVGDRYARFVERAQQIVQAHGKLMIGWQEIVKARLMATSIAQYWDTRSDAGPVREAARRGTKLVLSPASRVYLDMKYDRRTRPGVSWAGYVDVRDAYRWDPATLLAGVGDGQVLGVEAPLWGETIHGMRDVEFLAFPRLPGAAETGWSPAASRRWDDYRRRLAAQEPRWTAMGVSYYRSPQVG
jgi:hexosaminidase